MSRGMHKRKDKEGLGQSAHLRCLNGTLFCHVVLNKVENFSLRAKYLVILISWVFVVILIL